MNLSKRVLRAALVGLTCALLALAVPSCVTSSSGGNKSLLGGAQFIYKAGCKAEADCAPTGVCAKVGKAAYCVPKCSAGAVTGEGKPGETTEPGPLVCPTSATQGTCQKQADGTSGCVPSCSEGGQACPAGLTCGEGTCVPETNSASGGGTGVTATLVTGTCVKASDCKSANSEDPPLQCVPAGKSGDSVCTGTYKGCGELPGSSPAGEGACIFQCGELSCPPLPTGLPDLFYKSKCINGYCGFYFEDAAS